MALLRLGQSRLAGTDPQGAIEALEECIEIYPNDAVAYQARLDSPRAYQQAGKFKEAEQLLLRNLNGDGLTPASSEWQQSLFTLGFLLYETGRYEEAITKLQEAVDRDAHRRPYRKTSRRPAIKSQFARMTLSRTRAMPYWANTQLPAPITARRRFLVNACAKRKPRMNGKSTVRWSTTS